MCLLTWFGIEYEEIQRHKDEGRCQRHHPADDHHDAYAQQESRQGQPGVVTLYTKSHSIIPTILLKQLTATAKIKKKNITSPSEITISSQQALDRDFF